MSQKHCDRDLARAFGTDDREQWTESQRRVAMRIDWLENVVRQHQAERATGKPFEQIGKAVRLSVENGFPIDAAVELILSARKNRE